MNHYVKQVMAHTPALDHAEVPPGVRMRLHLARSLQACAQHRDEDRHGQTYRHHSCLDRCEGQGSACNQQRSAYNKQMNRSES